VARDVDPRLGRVAGRCYYAPLGRDGGVVRVRYLG
jgi:hypothetical protein